MDVTPPPSPKIAEDLRDKRRSGRHTARKKYVDDVDLNLSDDENLLMNLPPEAQAAAKAAMASDAAENDEKEGGPDSGTATPKEAKESENALAEKTAAELEDPAASGPNYAYVVSIFNDQTLV